jgi:L,D-transpeptidase catalytic domain/Putative peptidoglycan binding domain
MERLMPRRVALPLLALGALLALPAGASAKAAPRARRTGAIGLRVAGAFSVQGRTLAVTGRRLRIDGRIRPYVAGQRVTVRIWRGHKLIKQVRVKPRPTHTRKTARFSVRFQPDRGGYVQAFAVHERTDEQRKLVARAPLSVVSPSAGPGSRSPFVALLQQRLAAVGYATPQTGVYDSLTGLAVLAFRKVNGMERTTTLTPLVVDRLLSGAGGFKVRYPQHGRHVEANLGWQVLALIDAGRVVRAYTISSGKPSTPTVLGHFRFYMREPGTNSHGMVDSTYFIRGYAVHGYYDVPTYPASHGCLRVPIPDAYAIYSWIHLGDQIDVYY